MTADWVRTRVSATLPAKRLHMRVGWNLNEQKQKFRTPPGSIDGLPAIEENTVLSRALKREKGQGKKRRDASVITLNRFDCHPSRSVEAGSPPYRRAGVVREHSPVTPKPI